MTGLERSVWAISRTSSRIASVISPSNSSSKRLPWRTSVTPRNPKRGRAPRTAFPCGSRISGLGMTSTTTRGTKSSWWEGRLRGQSRQRGIVACPREDERETVSPPPGSDQLPLQDLAGGGHREGVHDADQAGVLVGGHLLLAPLDELVGGDGGAGV